MVSIGIISYLLIPNHEGEPLELANKLCFRSVIGNVGCNAKTVNKVKFILSGLFKINFVMSSKLHLVAQFIITESGNPNLKPSFRKGKACDTAFLGDVTTLLHVCLRA